MNAERTEKCEMLKSELSQLALVLPYLTKRQRDVLRSRVKRSHLLDIDRGYQGGNFGSAKSAFSGRRRQIFRSVGIRSAEPSNFVDIVGGSAKLGNRRNQGIDKIGGLSKSGNLQNRGISKIM